MTQCSYYTSEKKHERCPKEAIASGTVHIGNPTTGQAHALHFCSQHIGEARQAVKNAKRKEVEHG